MMFTDGSRMMRQPKSADYFITRWGGSPRVHQKSKPENYRAYAALAVQLANSAQDLEAETLMLSAAEAWFSLAWDAETLLLKKPCLAKELGSKSGLARASICKAA
jgi:hypothetical protein